MPTKKQFLELIKAASDFADEYRENNIDPVHQAADDAYHGILINSAEYEERGRSKLFIPKTRDHCRRWVNTIVNAFYLSDDIVTLSYPPSLEKQNFTNEVFNQRLELTTNFYKFLTSAAHAHVKYGNCIGKTGWEYKDAVRVEIDKERQIQVEVQDPIVDRPFFEVIPFENIQFDYRVISNDPLQESPFLRHLTPAYITDVEFMFEIKAWKKPRGLDYNKILVSSADERSKVRRNRQGEKADPTDNQIYNMAGKSLSYEQIWVVENYFRIGGTDWTFLSLGDEWIITDPVRVVDKFPHGRRPFAMSSFDPEAFRAISDGIPEMFKDLQAEANAIRNQRRDNVSLVLNARHYVARTAKINMQSLMSSGAGGVIIGNDVSPDKIRREEVLDVTSSAYNEEDITNRDIESVSGQSQNRLGVESADRTTATEAAIKASSSGELEGFIIKGFVEMLIRPLLEMYNDNLLEYEDDEEMFLKAALATGLSPDPGQMVKAEVVINAGMGSTNKELKSMRWEKIIDRMIQSQRGNLDAAFAEWLSLIGVKNTKRFLGQPQGAGLAESGGPPPVGANAPVPPGSQTGDISTAPADVANGGGAGGNIPNFGGLAGGMIG
jgi:hypothetical protein